MQGCVSQILPHLASNGTVYDTVLTAAAGTITTVVAGIIGSIVSL